MIHWIKLMYGAEVVITLISLWVIITSLRIIRRSQPSKPKASIEVHSLRLNRSLDVSENDPAGERESSAIKR